MSMPEPVWLKYAIYEQKDGYPILKGFRKDTPKEVLDAFKKEQKAVRRALDDGIEL